MDTIQAALKALYYSLGGNADNVRDTDDVNVIIAEIGKLGIGAALTSAAVKELPTAPDDDGTYTLQLVVDDGEATYSWESVSDGGGGGE